MASTTCAVRTASMKTPRGMETLTARVVRVGDVVWKRPSARALAAMEPAS